MKISTIGTSIILDFRQFSTSDNKLTWSTIVTTPNQAVYFDKTSKAGLTVVYQLSSGLILSFRLDYFTLDCTKQQMEILSLTKKLVNDEIKKLSITELIEICDTFIRMSANIAFVNGQKTTQDNIKRALGIL